MSLNKFPGDFVQDVSDLQNDVAGQQAGQKRTPLTRASAGWVLPDMTTPTAPASGVHLHASGGSAAIVTASGSVLPWLEAAANVSDPPALTSAQITGGQSPTETEYNQLQADVAAMRTALVALNASLRAALHLV